MLNLKKTASLGSEFSYYLIVLWDNIYTPSNNDRCYNTTLRAIIPLPDPNAPPTSAAHLNAYQEFPTASTVMALYPDTSCFYRAEVIASPKDMQPSGRVSLFSRASISICGLILQHRLLRLRSIYLRTNSNLKMTMIKNIPSRHSGLWNGLEFEDIADFI